jgi:peroxiredoxin Q/BCP
MITVGMPAPTFTLPDQTDTSVSLGDFKGKWIILYFYPKDDTPGCTLEAVEFSQKRPLFESKNAVVLGISKDSTESHQKFCGKHNLNVSLLSDPHNTVIEAYGAWKEKTNYGKTYMGIVRSTILINPDGNVAKIWSNVKVAGHVDTVLKAIGE